MRIPRFFGESLPTIPDVSAGAAAAPYEAQAQLGAAISDIGSKLLATEIRVAEEKKKVEQTMFTQTLVDEYRRKMIDLDSELQQDPNIVDYIGKMEAGSQKAMSEIYGKVKDPVVLGNLKKRLSDVSTDIYAKAKAFDNAKFISTMVGDAKVKLYNLSKAIGEADSEEERIKLSAEGIVLINGISGMLGKEEAANWKIAFDKQNVAESKKANFRKARLEIDSIQDPKLLEQENINKILDKYGIKEEDGVYLFERANRAKTILENKINSEKETSTFIDLKNKWTDSSDVTNYNGIYKDLSNPKYWREERGLSDEQKYHLENRIAQEERFSQKQRQDIWDKSWQTDFPKLIDHTLTLDEVKRKTETNEYSPEMGRFFKSAIENPVDIKTDGIFYISTLEKILKNGNARKEIFWGAGEGKKLSHEDAGELIKLQYAKEKQPKDHYTSDPWFQLSKQEFNSHFGNVEESIEEAIQRKLKGLPAPKKDYDNYFQTMSKLMRAIEKDKLIGEDIYKKAQELLKASIMEKGNKVTKGKDQYGFEIGEVRPHGNNNWEYIGNNQWRKKATF